MECYLFTLEARFVPILPTSFVLMFIYCRCSCIYRIDFQGHDTTVVVMQGDIKVLEQYCASMFLKMTLISSGRCVRSSEMLLSTGLHRVISQMTTPRILTAGKI
jgi:hypothetical protein